jgi:hypothetical protein
MNDPQSDRPRASGPNAAAVAPLDGGRDGALVRGRLGPVEYLAGACILLGWFGLSTFVTDYGPLSQHFHFYDVWTVIEHPSRLMTGMQSGDGSRSFAFGIVCVATVLCVFLPVRSPQPSAFLAYLIPLALMLVCGSVLYHEATQRVFADTYSYGETGSQAAQLANLLADRMTRALTRRISLGWGAYLALLGSLVLAVRGLMQYRLHSAAAPSRSRAEPAS